METQKKISQNLLRIIELIERAEQTRKSHGENMYFASTYYSRWSMELIHRIDILTMSIARLKQRFNKQIVLLESLK
jgi:uncharacterized small protein (DUF1192 family)